VNTHDAKPGGADVSFAPLDKQLAATLVPIDEEFLYFSLAGEMLRLAGMNAAPGMTIHLDAETALEADLWQALCATHSVVIWGKSAPTHPRATIRDEAASIDGFERFTVICGPGIRLAAVAHTEVNVGSHFFWGGWSPDPEFVHYAVSCLGDNGACPPMDPAADYARVAASVVQLCTAHTRHITSRQRVMAMSKHDLFSVLNILKAISAKRRAHDILYVFVESIARVVPMNRCSVVRVWGGDDSGQVLASHEDKMVSDLPIELAKYPEIIKALDEGQKVIVSDVAKDALTQPHLSDLSQAGISSILVIPIVLYDNSVGSLLLRGSRSDGPFSSREISFCEIVAEAAANALEKAHLFESIQKANEGLEFLAVTDGLTGLYNHRYFRDRLADEFERATRYKLPLSCLILDVDNFKRINDTFGHLRGDSILKEIAGRVVRTVRKADIVARYGGEEIVVIMPQTNADGAMAQAERIRRTIAEVAFGEAGNAIHVTASVGVGVLRQESMRDCEALIREADSALYQAKAAGKNNVILGGT
jgi:diguanylate cyclase (GGDEF)-like protein